MALLKLSLLVFTVGQLSVEILENMQMHSGMLQHFLSTLLLLLLLLRACVRACMCNVGFSD